MRDCLAKEVKYRTSRSSGAGGQHVNKTETRVELLWSPATSSCLDEVLKQRLIFRLRNRISYAGVLSLASEKYRSQVRNREEVFERFFQLVQLALLPPKKRLSTRIPRGSREERIRQKKYRGTIKQNRRKPLRED